MNWIILILAGLCEVGFSFCLGKTKGRPHPEIDAQVLRQLRDFYRPFNRKFYQMTGHDFGWDG